MQHCYVRTILEHDRMKLPPLLASSSLLPPKSSRSDFSPTCLLAGTTTARVYLHQDAIHVSSWSPCSLTHTEKEKTASVKTKKNSSSRVLRPFRSPPFVRPGYSISVCRPTNSERPHRPPLIIPPPRPLKPPRPPPPTPLPLPRIRCMGRPASLAGL